MSIPVKPKTAAATRGCLTARQWQDLRHAARLAQREGVTLILHGVTVGPARSSENLPQPQQKPTMTTAPDGRGLTGTVNNACEHSSTEQHERTPKKQREQQRSLERCREFHQAKACGAHWLPLVQKLLRQGRAISRSCVWTQHLAQKLALRDKMAAFLGRALHAANYRSRPAENQTMVVRDPERQMNLLGSEKLSRFATKYRHLCNLRAARRVMKNLKDFFRYYRKTLNMTLAYHIVPFTHTDLLTGTVHEVTRPHELSPPRRRPHTPPDPPANRRAPKKGSPSWRR